MINNILVPTDFSLAANNALSFALRFAQKCNATVHVLHVNTIPAAGAYFPEYVYPSVITEMESAAKASFDQLKKTYADFRLKDITVMGFIQDEIRKYTAENEIDLVVMGTTGASGLNELLLGSNAAAVAVKSAVPVLVIPPSAAYQDLKRVVYATDYSEPEFPAVSRLIYLAELFDAQVDVLHVRSESDRYFKSEYNFFVKNKYHISYPKWKMVKADARDTMDGIDHYVDSANADLLVVAKHNRHFFDRMFHRSLSKRMAFHTRIPLLVLNK